MEIEIQFEYMTQATDIFSMLFFYGSWSEIQNADHLLH